MIRTDYYADELNLDAEIQEGSGKGSKARHVFCIHWDSARTGLLTLKFLLSKKIMISFIIGAIIKIGDKIQATYCI